ncbi:MAG: 3'(2'),5'-bisphosphate nucleotidase CysQ [Candidatus Marinimicrobia bacterium]|jgi:myo-inositol-1(or 4)-monophosphatase|nr:3'(2'),5'-bisphosphate nucleotidase CysQ [Candidatus Neomarinimicrobiota bacterium]MBT3629945.1 3'(2'),5'-bisphosphate nucleotidase CysQ [Candidatus Neomarinimicrobiota bacterium]MBT3825566.1 3'(2'),5'-bisphosphate nucleotidase CysQ [Candidatus Neomarinimicrobiota bacterium]MBT4130992.1 3'(2'),5'-bisphosphate nucleotidase CysQ [Candidatus Neomarinimicrobiota bacterium]MBT4295001.1 3'(2'),5'-bisphosphate nucleotidase CysQ [Candidatus Neomarinimicrobiota bacterium]
MLYTAMVNLHTLAADAAQKAGQILLKYYKNTYEIHDKGYHNPVTTADHEADAFLKQFLMEATPEYGWLSEETVDSPERLDKEFVWIVDPLDGTKEFIEGIPHFVTSIGLAQNGIPILGVLYNPVTEELIRTDQDGVVWYQDQKAVLCQETLLKDVGCLNSRSETRRGLWKPWANEFKELIPIGSVAYKLGLVAAGQQDFFVTLRPKNEWDVCAGHALLKGLGGTMKTITGAEISYNQPDTIIKPGMTGGNKALVEAFINRYNARKGK